MYVIYLDIWIFGYMAEVRVEMKFVQKTACPYMSTFFQILDNWKGFDGNLEHPNIWIFEYLNRYMNYSIYELQQSPIRYFIYIL